MDVARTDADGYYLPATLTDDMIDVYAQRVYGLQKAEGSGLKVSARIDYKRIYDNRYTVPACKNELDKLTALFIALRFKKAAS